MFFFKKYTQKEAVKSLVINAIIAAAYVVLTLLNSSFSYGAIQFRISEMLVLICFFRPDTIIGLTLGCLLANCSPASIFPYDIFFGTMGTLISCIIMVYMPRLFPAALAPVIINGLVVGAELYFVLGLDFWSSVGWVALGEFAVLMVGYAVFMVLMRNKRFLDVIGTTRHREVKW